MPGFDLTEFYEELQGRPESKGSLDMEGRWPHIPADHIKAYMIKDFSQLITYLSRLEILHDDMLELLLDEDFGLEARYELLDSWFTDLEDIIGTKSTDAATGAVSNAKKMMAYVKQLVTAIQLIPTTMVGTDDAALASVLGALDSAAATGAVSDAKVAMAYIKQLVTLLRDGTYGLAALETLVDDLETRLGTPAAGTVAGDVESIETKVGTNADAAGTTTLFARVRQIVDTYLADGTVGLANLKTLIDAIETKLDTPANFMADLSTLESRVSANVALASVLGALNAATASGAVDDATVAMGYLKQLVTAVILILADTADMQPKLGSPDADLAADIAAIKTILDTPANFMADGVQLSSDWTGGFSWITATHTTNNVSLSQFFSPDLTGTTRRKYTVYLDLTNVEADASFVSCYIGVYIEIDGTNSRCIDRKLVEKADIAATAEPGIVIDIPAVAVDVAILMQMTIALAGDATIYYAVVKEHLE